MKIDAFNINLSSQHSFIQKDHTQVSQEVSFSKLFDQKIEEQKPQAPQNLNLFQNNSQRYEIIPIQNNRVVSLKEQFMAELDKMRQILDAILKGLNNACDNASLNLTALDRININMSTLPRPGLYQYEYRETKIFTHYEKENTDFFADGAVNTKDGRSIDLSLEMNLSREFFKQDQFVYSEKGYTLIDPLILNLEMEPPEIAQVGFSFDLDMDGNEEVLPSLMPGTGILSLDRNRDGIINDGSELFGPSTGNGFEELSQYDLDRNYWIDENDAVFDELTIWESDEQGEMHLTKIKDAGLGAIYLESINTPFDLRNENNELQARIKRSGIALNEDGSLASVHEMDWAG